MAGNLLVVLAASGLIASGSPTVTQTRPSEAMPAATTGFVQSAPAANVGSACFVPLKGGKIASLSDFSKAKATGHCAEAQLGDGGFGYHATHLPFPVYIVGAGQLAFLSFALLHCTKHGYSPC